MSEEIKDPDGILRFYLDPRSIDDIEEGGIEAAKQAIADGADVNAMYEDGNTPLDMAIWGNLPEIAELLRKRGGKTSNELRVERRLTKHK